MARVITFSRNFPSYHQKKGEPTCFIEKIWNSLYVDALNEKFLIPFEEDLYQLNKGMPYHEYMTFRDALIISRTKFKPKYHTIRGGNRWKAGDIFSPRAWSGKPYHSKQIVIAPNIEIKKVWDIEIKKAYKQLPLDYDTDIIINHKFYHTDDEIMKTLAMNDGLSLAELLQWFKYPKPFQGQIICWNENIEY